MSECKVSIGKTVTYDKRKEFEIGPEPFSYGGNNVIVRQETPGSDTWEIVRPDGWGRNNGFYGMQYATIAYGLSRSDAKKAALSYATRKCDELRRRD